jgi:hypothetical protein
MLEPKTQLALDLLACKRPEIPVDFWPKPLERDEHPDRAYLPALVPRGRRRELGYELRYNGRKLPNCC